MSFKREGNDKNHLNILRQRRIRDLLAEDIPQDEATLLSNGRLACTVCASCPVFDTVNMLTIHRHGKKHKASLLYKEREKQELKNLIMKRKHEQFLKDGTTSIQQAAANDKGLWNNKPYDPRVKKHKLKPYDRKPTLNLSETQFAPVRPVAYVDNRTDYTASHSTNQYQEKLTIKHGDQLGETNSVSSSSLPGNQDVRSHVPVAHEDRKVFRKKSVTQKNKSKFLEMITMQQEGPVKHSPQLSKIFEKPGESNTSSVVYHPYRSKNYRHLVSEANSKGETAAFKKEHSPIRIHLKRPTPNQQISVPSGNVKKGEVKAETCDDKLQSAELSCPESGGSPSQKTNNQECSADKKDEKSDSRKRWQLGGSGWKRDWDGKWIKDEQAEFDSDEDPPDL